MSEERAAPASGLYRLLHLPLVYLQGSQQSTTSRGGLAQRINPFPQLASPIINEERRTERVEGPIFASDLSSHVLRKSESPAAHVRGALFGITELSTYAYRQRSSRDRAQVAEVSFR